MIYSIGLNQIIQHQTTSEAWAYAVNLIKRYGREQPSAYGPTKEIEDLVLTVLDPRLEDPIPKIDVAIKPNWAFPEQMKPYVRDCWMRGDNPNGAEYTYGQFIWPQIDYVIRTLKEDRDSRRAVITLWDPLLKEPPCCNRLDFRIRRYFLNVTADFRSLDVYSAYPADMLGIAAIQDYIAQELVEYSGSITTRADCAHVYLKDVA